MKVLAGLAIEMSFELCVCVVLVVSLVSLVPLALLPLGAANVRVRVPVYLSNAVHDREQEPEENEAGRKVRVKRVFAVGLAVPLPGVRAAGRGAPAPAVAHVPQRAAKRLGEVVVVVAQQKERAPSQTHATRGEERKREGTKIGKRNSVSTSGVGSEHGRCAGVSTGDVRGVSKDDVSTGGAWGVSMRGVGSVRNGLMGS